MSISQHYFEHATEHPSWGSDLIRDDDLKNGIWPRSFPFWVINFWMGLLIVRPWERLVPELLALRPEFTYSLFAILVVSLSGQFRFRSSLQTTALLVWAVALSLSTLLAQDVSIAWQALYGYFTTFIFYFMLLSVIRTPYMLIFFIASLVAVTTAYLGKSQWEYFLYGGFSFAMGVRRLSGIDVMYSHPNAVACTAVLALPFVALLWHVREDFTATWPNWWRKHFPKMLALALGIILSSVVLTNSRSGLLGVILAAFLWSLGQNIQENIWRRLFWGSVILLCIWICMPEDSKGRFRNIWDAESGPEAESAHMSAEGRLVGLQQGMEIFRRFPITGVGLGNFTLYRALHLDGARMVAHNTIGGVLGDTGLIGGLAFAFFIGSVFITTRRIKTLSLNTHPEDTKIMYAVAVASWHSVILIIFLGMFGDIQGRIHLYWVVAIVALANEFAMQVFETRDRVDRANASPY